MKLEGVLAPDAKVKQRHTLHRRVIQFMEHALRVTTAFSGLEGHVACSHSARCGGFPVAVTAAFPPPSARALRPRVNTDEVKCTVLKKSTTDTRTSDESLQERA